MTALEKIARYIGGYDSDALPAETARRVIRWPFIRVGRP